MAPPSHLDVDPAAQRAIYIGDVCPPTSLMLARRYVDLLAHPPPPPKDLSQRTHPLRRVLECTTEEMAKTTTSSSSSSSCTPPTSAELRRALVQRHGSPDGSRMFREWVERPRTTLQNAVRHLCDGIQRYYTNNTAARDVLDDLDLHVRLYPTSCPSSCMPPTMAACGVMCAAVIVRRRSSLRQLREELMQLSARYVGVAAEGQTLEDSLAFWRITSYEHERLLMEEEDLLNAPDAHGANDADGPSPSSSSSSSSWNAWESSLSAEDRGMLADIFRRPPLGWSSVSAAAEELRGAAPQRADGEKDGEGGRRTRIILGPTEEVGTMAAHLPSFSQPTLLVEKKGGRSGGRPDPSTRKRRRDAPTSSSSSISQSMCGLVGVWYVSVDGMAYLGYPTPPPSLATTTTSSSSSFPPPSLMPALNVADEMNEAEMKTTLPKAPLPLNSELSFTRGLLRL